MTPRDDLVARLRSMGRLEHDDLSIGDEAADRIEALSLQVQMLTRERDEARDERDRIRLAFNVSSTAREIVLEADLAAARELLREWIEMWSGGSGEDNDEVMEKARVFLAGKEKP